MSSVVGFAENEKVRKNEISEIKRLVVDASDGEILSVMGDGDRIVRGGRERYYKGDDEGGGVTLEWSVKNFLKMNVPEVRLWMKDLDSGEKVFLFSVVPYISYTDCRITNDRGEDAGSEDLVEITGLSRASVYRAIESLIKKDILYKGKNSKNRQYFVNPWIFYKGNRINQVLKTMFKNYCIRIKGNKRWKDLSD